jgi:hypothetical protein
MEDAMCLFDYEARPMYYRRIRSKPSDLSGKPRL